MRRATSAPSSTRWACKHELLAGVDFAREEKTVYAARTRRPGRRQPDQADHHGRHARRRRRRSTKPRACCASPAQYTSQAAGRLRAGPGRRSRPHWKLLAGLRYDNLVGDYDTFAIPNNARRARAPPPATAMKVSELEQAPRRCCTSPTPLHSLPPVRRHLVQHLGRRLLAAAPPNVEHAAGAEPSTSSSAPSSTRPTSASPPALAVFRSDQAATSATPTRWSTCVTSCRASATSAGVEIDLTGRITPEWEVFGSYMWMPDGQDRRRRAAGRRGPGHAPLADAASLAARSGPPTS